MGKKFMDMEIVANFKEVMLGQHIIDRSNS